MKSGCRPSPNGLCGHRYINTIRAQQRRRYPILSLLYKARFFEYLFQCSYLFAGLDESRDRIADISSGLLQIVTTRRYVKGNAMSDYDCTLFVVDDRNCLELDTHSLIFSTYRSGCTTPGCTAYNQGTAASRSPTTPRVKYRDTSRATHLAALIRFTQRKRELVSRFPDQSSDGQPSDHSRLEAPTKPRRRRGST